MPSSRDYVPSNAAQFNLFMQNLLHIVSEKTISPGGGQPPAWNHIPQVRHDALSDAFAAFTQAFETAVDTPTHGNILRRQEAQAACTTELRGFVNQFLRFPPVTNPDRTDMGIPNHDTVRTDHKVVTETVDFVIHLRNIRELVIDFWQAGLSSKAKPQSYDGAVIIWGVLDAPPQKPEELIHHSMASRTPFTLHFEEPERGKTVYVAAAWQNERGILGQWSEYKNAIVP